MQKSTYLFIYLTTLLVAILNYNYIKLCGIHYFTKFSFLSFYPDKFLWCVLGWSWISSASKDDLNLDPPASGFSILVLSTCGVMSYSRVLIFQVILAVVSIWLAIFVIYLTINYLHQRYQGGENIFLTKNHLNNLSYLYLEKI